MFPPVRATNPITPLGRGVNPHPLPIVPTGGQPPAQPPAHGHLPYQKNPSNQLDLLLHRTYLGPPGLLAPYEHGGAGDGGYLGRIEANEAGMHSDPMSLLRGFLHRQHGGPLPGPHRIGGNPGGAMLPGPTTLGTNPLADLLLALAGGSGGRPMLAS